MYALAYALASVWQQVRIEADSFRRMRAATRLELYRRLHRGRDFLASSFEQPLTVSEVARCLLAGTGEAITTICFAVGFESLGSFSWRFRKRLGISPSAYRAAGIYCSITRRS
ncbi:MAG TPA: helix-turn-helix domain-containing protein [Bryobacteraceae bacterium]|nr:helix-turn-helix domain-containing protein [Bryobacteraceae bacterium]